MGGIITGPNYGGIYKPAAYIRPLMMKSFKDGQRLEFTGPRQIYLHSHWMNEYSQPISINQLSFIFLFSEYENFDSSGGLPTGPNTANFCCWDEKDGELWQPSQKWDLIEIWRKFLDSNIHMIISLTGAIFQLLNTVLSIKN